MVWHDWFLCAPRIRLLPAELLPNLRFFASETVIFMNTSRAFSGLLTPNNRPFKSDLKVAERRRIALVADDRIFAILGTDGAENLFERLDPQARALCYALWTP